MASARSAATPRCCRSGPHLPSHKRRSRIRPHPAGELVDEPQTLKLPRTRVLEHYSRKAGDRVLPGQRRKEHAFDAARSHRKYWPPNLQSPDDLRPAPLHANARDPDPPGQQSQDRPRLPLLSLSCGRIPRRRIPPPLKPSAHPQGAPRRRRRTNPNANSSSKPFSFAEILDRYLLYLPSIPASHSGFPPTRMLSMKRRRTPWEEAVALSAKKIPNEPNFARYLKKLSQLCVVVRTHRHLSPFGRLRRPFVMRTACILLAISLGLAAQPLPGTEAG